MWGVEEGLGLTEALEEGWAVLPFGTDRYLLVGRGLAILLFPFFVAVPCPCTWPRVWEWAVAEEAAEVCEAEGARHRTRILSFSGRR